MERKHYILDRDIATPENELTALESCIGANYTQRYNINDRKIYIKTYDTLSFDGIVEYTTDELNTNLPYLYEELDGIEWTNNEVI